MASDIADILNLSRGKAQARASWPDVISRRFPVSRIPSRNRGFQAPENHPRHLRTELLRYNRPYESGEGRFMKLNSISADTLDDRPENRVLLKVIGYFSHSETEPVEVTSLKNKTFMKFTIWAALALTATSLGAQELPEPIKVDVNVVNMLAAVHDKKGGLITTLKKEDFTLLEDGQPQTIKYFTKETDLPLTIGLLVDVSGSQANLIDIEKRAATDFFRSVLKKKDVAFVISFGADSELLQDITSSPRLLQEGLDRLRLNAGVSGVHPGPVPTASQPKGTVLYDAVSLAATDRLAKEVGRKVIVLITDGVDQGSSYTIKRAIEDAQKADSVIYSIYYVDPGAYMGRGDYQLRGRRRRLPETDVRGDRRPCFQSRPRPHITRRICPVAGRDAQPVRDRLDAC